MASTTPTAAGVSRLMGFGYTIYSAIRAGATVSELWSAVRDAGGVSPGESLGASIFDMNYVAGLWRGVATASSNLNGAAPTDAIDASMTAWAPWTLGGAGASISPEYQVRYGASYGEGGSAGTIYQTVSISGSLEGLTVGDIGNMALGGAQAIEQGDLGTTPPSPELTAVIGSGSVSLVPGSLMILRV